MFLVKIFAENRHSITVLEKVTKEYMNNITSVKEKENIDTIKNDEIVKLPWVLKIAIFILGRNLKNLICWKNCYLIAHSW